MNPLAALSGGAPASALLLATIVGVSLLGLYANPAIVERSLFRPHHVAARGEWATVVASGFVHADLPHLLFNGITFWAFGFGLEARIGTASFVGLYTVGLLASAFGTWIKHRGDPGYATLGASGAILAVLFASIVVHPGGSIFILPIPVPIPAPLFAVAYLAYTVWASRQHRGRVNHDAHFSGAIAGVAWVVLTDPAAVGRFAAAVGIRS